MFDYKNKINLFELINIKYYDYSINDLIYNYVEQLVISYQYLVLQAYKELYLENNINNDDFWIKISKNKNLTLDFIYVFKKDLYWDLLNIKEIYEHIDIFHDYIDMKNKIVSYKSTWNENKFMVTKDLIMKYPNLNYDWYKITKYLCFDIDFMHKFKDEIFWDYLYIEHKINFNERLKMIDYYKEYLIKKNNEITLYIENYYSSDDDKDEYDNKDEYDDKDEYVKNKKYFHKKIKHMIVDDYKYNKNDIEYIVSELIKNFY